MADAPRSLNSDISYFGVGGKQAIFFIGDSTQVGAFNQMNCIDFLTFCLFTVDLYTYISAQIPLDCSNHRTCLQALFSE